MNKSLFNSLVVLRKYFSLHIQPYRVNMHVTFYVYGSVHRWSILIIVRDATQSSLFIILQVHSTCFGCQPHPSSGVHKTVTTASRTGHNFCAATFVQRGQASLATLERGSWEVREAVVIVLCTPDDGCGLHPKHIEWTCRRINILFWVASRWAIINMHMQIIFGFALP